MTYAGNEDTTYECNLSPSLLRKAEIELSEKDKWRDRDIQALRNMVQMHEGLRSQTADAFLLRFLRAGKFDYDRAYRMLLNYYTVRAVNSGILNDLNPRAIENVLNTGIVSVLPLRDTQGCQIMYLRPGNWNPSKLSILDILRSVILNLELAVMKEETQICGLVVICNMDDTGLAHARNIDRNHAKLMTNIVQEAFPLRLKGIHFVNEPAIFGSIFMVLKPFFKKKIVDRLVFHGSSLENLHKHFDANILPEELGGSLPNGAVLSEDWKLKALEYQLMFEDAQKYGIEITKNSACTKADDAVECFIGTYRNLNSSDS